MIEAIHGKPTYLSRILYSGCLITVLFISSAFINTSINFQSLNEPNFWLWVGMGALVLLSFLSMKLMSELLERLTGFSFFLSLPGLVILFVISLMLAIIIVPLYLIFNLIQYFRAS